MSPTHARANNAHPPHLVAQLVMVYNSHHYDAQVTPGGGCGASWSVIILLLILIHLIHLIITMLIHLIFTLICPGDPKWRVWSSSSQHPPPWPLTQSPNTGILTHQQGHHQEYLHCIIFFPAVLLSKVEDPVKGSVYRNYRLHLPMHWPRVCWSLLTVDDSFASVDK